MLLMATEAWIALSITAGAVLLALVILFSMLPLLRSCVNTKRM